MLIINFEMLTQERSFFFHPIFEIFFRGNYKWEKERDLELASEFRDSLLWFLEIQFLEKKSDKELK